MESGEKRGFFVPGEDGKPVSYTTRKPNGAEFETAAVEYSRVMFSCFSKGVPTKAAVTRTLRASGLWGEKEDNDMEEIRLRAIALAKKLDEAEETEKESLRIVFDETKQLFDDRKNELKSYYENTAEEMAANAERTALVSLVTERNGVRVWPTVEAIKNEKNSNLIYQATLQYLGLMNNLPAGFDKVDETDEAEGEEIPSEKTADGASVQAIGQPEVSAIDNKPSVITEATAESVTGDSV